MPGVSEGGEKPSALTKRVHSSSTAATKDGPTAVLAILPALDRVSEAIAAMHAKPKNFIHIAATILSEMSAVIPPAVSALCMASQRLEGCPFNSPKAVILIRNWLC